MRLIVLLAALALPTPKAPEVCEPVPMLVGQLCPASDTRWYFSERVGCDAPVAVSNCDEVAVEEDLAPPPFVDPAFNEFDPIGPLPGPPGAPTVDRPE